MITKSNKTYGATDFFESMLEVGDKTGKKLTKQFNKTSKASLKSLKKELAKMPQDFMDEIFGPELDKKASANIKPGETLKMDEMLSKDNEKKHFLEKQLVLERQLHQKEIIFVQRRSNELRIQLNAVMEEVLAVAQQTNELASETKIAAMQAPIEPGVYHIVFFTNLLNYLKSFRKKIENASVWLHAANGRAEKVNWVTNYKKSGAKYLLSGEHYISRSAG